MAYAETMSPDVDAGRLWKAAQASRRVLKVWREQRVEAVQQYVGAHWSDSGSRQKVPVNLLALYVSIVSRNLVARDPRVMLSVARFEHKAAVSAMESWMNREIRRMYLGETLQAAVVDALFSVGIIKVGLTSPSSAAQSSYARVAGQPFAEPVDLDDWVHDTSARCFRECSFLGHRYKAPKDVLLEGDYLPAGAKKAIETASQPTTYNEEGDSRIGQVGAGSMLYEESLEDYAELWEFYLPRRKLVVTLVEGHTEPVEVKEWLGPDCGPYHFLGYGHVPGSAMPLAPVHNLLDLHDLTNNLYRKLEDQARRQKTLTAYAGTEADAQRVQSASDGDGIRLDQPDRVQEVSFGGMNQLTSQFALHAFERFNWMAGNLEALGGLGAQSPTATQDQMLERNASKLVADLQDRTVKFSGEVLRALGWYWWHDPFQTMTSTWTAPGMPDLSLTRRVSPQRRAQVPFEDLDLDVDPYSMQQDTPESKLRVLMQTMTQAVVPMMPALQQQGVVTDVTAFLRLVAKWSNLPELEEVVAFADLPQIEGPSAGQDGPHMAPNTSRTYERVSRPGGSRAGRDLLTMQTFAAGANGTGGGNPFQQAG